MATFFGFISCSCSLAALATTRALFAKGAGLVPSLTSLLASTSLVAELGTVIAVFLGWKMALYILAIFLFIPVASALIRLYGFGAVARGRR